ncbi:MAG: DUF799 family lipoprotein [Elusimicrobia bacterium]|nr:DUF799 family lipoprotein [Elusimicrobiota bacterium]
MSLTVKFSSAFLAFFLISCASAQKRPYFINEKFSSVAETSVAVLPFDNESVDIDSEKYMRDEVIKKLVSFGYSPLTSSYVDEKLKEIGISDGGQLKAYKTSDLASKLSCRILIYGTIENYIFQNLGFIVRKKAELYLRAEDGYDGAVLYEGFGAGDDSKIYTSKKEAETAFVLNTGVKLVSNISNKNFLMGEAVKKSVEKALEKFPRR